MSDAAERLSRLMTWATGYDLIADVVLWGPYGERRAQLAKIPELASEVEGKSEDDLLAGHYDLFGRAVPPFANAFVDPSGLAGGDVAVSLGRLYREIGFRPSPDAPGEDHLGVILEALAHSVLTEVEMLRHGETRAAEAARAAQRTLIERHVLTWILPVTEAVARESRRLYGRLLTALLEVVAAHRAALEGDDPQKSSDVQTSKGSEPEPTQDPSQTPSDSDSGPSALAGWLATPARSGVYWSRRHVQALAEESGVPTGFAPDRAALISETLKGATRFGCAKDLLGRFAASAEAAARSYEASPEGLALVARQWSRMARATATRLTRLAALPELEDEGDGT